MKISSIQVLLCCELLLYAQAIPLIGQTPEKEEPKSEFAIKVGVEEVRIDAVVLDHKGHQITDLNAEDFEIFQDGARQNIISIKYINDYNPQPEIQSRSLKNPKAIPLLPSPMPTKDEIRRTFVFLVDNVVSGFDSRAISQRFVQVSDARMAMRRFVETQMQPGDLMAIVATGYGTANPFQLFTSDKRHLLAMINRVQFLMGTGFYQSPLTSLSYCIDALKDLPGRKYLIDFASNLPPDINYSRMLPELGYQYNKIGDAALRAGVVIHEFDIRGLEGLESILPTFTAENGHVDPSVIPAMSTGRYPGKASILTKKTGGLFIENSNFFVTKSGVGRVSEELKGYYLITYIPPAGTFKDAFPKTFHKIKIVTKRPGSKVHTRDGFLGRIESENASGTSGLLKDAIFSPFRYNALQVNLSSGFICDPQNGYVLQSWLHVDAKDLNIVEGKDGNPSVSLTGLCLTSDVDNDIQDVSSQRYDYYFKKEDIPWIREHGLKFSLILPVKKPGAYYVRAAVKDEGSGKIGSAYQYLEIPNLKNNNLSLSNIFLITREEDAPWARHEIPGQSQRVLYPDAKMDPRRSPAIRSFLPGETFDYAAMIYNAGLQKENKTNLTSQYMLIRDGEVLFTSEFENVDLSGVSDLARIPIRKHFVLENSIEPGDYVLLLIIKNKNNFARQALDFTVQFPAVIAGR
jgi:VWFA-related protein